REEVEGGAARTGDFAEMKALMSSAVGVLVAPRNGFVKGAKYEIRIKAELHTVKLPMGLDYVLIFVKLWDFETDWYAVTFSP
ncbi:MAG: DUF4390 domain-containing protein, partial [Deltaproteobacteria bacterium]|nr:DUF4390 domain-containing protein [Deltaproteobacteria bacterium]